MAAAIVSSLLAVTAAAQKYPDRPITFVVPWAAGGGADLASRLFGPPLERELGVPVNIINRTGGKTSSDLTPSPRPRPPARSAWRPRRSPVSKPPASPTSRPTPTTSLDLLNFPAGITVKANSPHKTAGDRQSAEGQPEERVHGVGHRHRRLMAHRDRGSRQGRGRGRRSCALGAEPGRRAGAAGCRCGRNHHVLRLAGRGEIAANSGRVRILALMADERSAAPRMSRP